MTPPAMLEADPIAEELFRYGSHERPAAFLRLFAREAPDDGARFWRLVAAEWAGFDAIPHRAYAAAFRRYRGAWFAEAMAPEDLAFWNALPESLTVYRGQDASAPLGLSWTLSREVAEQFARGHRGLWNRSPVILETTLPKTCVALALTERKEAEIVLFRAPRRRDFLPAT